MHTFKFGAKGKSRFFGEDECCYVMIYSSMGCTIKMKPTATQLKSMQEPEKKKEFNVGMTKSEM